MDSVVQEVREIREAYTRQFGYDLQAIHRDLKAQEQAGGRRVVSLPPRRPKPIAQRPSRANNAARTTYAPESKRTPKIRFSNPATRRLLPTVIFAILRSMVVASWGMMRFVLRDAQNRSLAPEHYNVEVLTTADYRRLADPSNRDVTLSDGRTIHKAPIWDQAVLPNYKSTADETCYLASLWNLTASNRWQNKLPGK